MYLDNLEKMDPVMAMSIVNMKLRNEFNGNLDELAKTYDIDRKHLEERLKTAGFLYHEEIGQFR
ncbi:DUF4250 domain-containing protein [Psychromonas sp. KJ10-10]|uniref:DUF4250 domain-containing protein n=1 Tax=Psychromonas sp. KJ10-10 TaxID=3391823 RepID=UPI0039B655B0